MAIMDIKVSLEHTLQLHRCTCHRLYAVQSPSNFGCGLCAEERVAQLRKELATAERKISALRSCLVRNRRFEKTKGAGK